MTGRRVLFVHATVERYGGDRALVLLAADLVERGWQVTVVVPEDGPLVGDLREVGAAVVESPVAAIRVVYRPRDWLRFFLRDLPVAVIRTRRLARRADVVHLNSSIVAGAAIGAWLSRRPVVWHLRESFADFPRMWRLYGRFVALVADTVVANSSHVADLARQAGARRVVVVPDGMRFAPLPPGRAAGDRLVTVARINAGKGHEFLVDALAILRGRGIDVPATFAGDAFPGAEIHVSRLRERIAAAGLEDLVALPGFVDDVPGLLSTARLFVLPSRRPEGFGLALLEAMGAGVACVATNAGGPVDIIRDGETGLLVPPADAQALADAIERLWCDDALRDRIAAAGCADVRERFDHARTTDGVIAVYENLLR